MENKCPNCGSFFLCKEHERKATPRNCLTFILMTGGMSLMWVGLLGLFVVVLYTDGTRTRLLDDATGMCVFLVGGLMLMIGLRLFSNSERERFKT